MFEDSNLLRRDVLVLRATAPPDAQFSVLDETGREIVSSELRLAALGCTIGLVDEMSRKPAWMLKGFPKLGQAWPGSSNGHLPPTAA